MKVDRNTSSGQISRQRAIRDKTFSVAAGRFIVAILAIFSLFTLALEPVQEIALAGGVDVGPLIGLLALMAIPRTDGFRYAVEQYLAHRTGFPIEIGRTYMDWRLNLVVEGGRLVGVDEERLFHRANELAAAMVRQAEEVTGVSYLEPPS